MEKKGFFLLCWFYRDITLELECKGENIMDKMCLFEIANCYCFQLSLFNNSHKYAKMNLNLNFM
jgi:hypothetical protein